MFSIDPYSEFNIHPLMTIWTFYEIPATTLMTFEPEITSIY